MPHIVPRSPAARPTTRSATKSPAAKSPAARSPAAKSPAKRAARQPDEPGVAKARHRARSHSTGDRISTKPRRTASTDTKAVARRETEARRAYALGELAFETGRLGHALEHFERGYELSKRPAFLFNIGQTLWSLGKLRRAAHVLKIYRAKAPATQRPKIDGLLAQIANSGR